MTGFLLFQSVWVFFCFWVEQPEKLFRFFVDYFSVVVLSAALLSAHLQGLLQSLKLERGKQLIFPDSSGGREAECFLSLARRRERASSILVIS